ncbi:13936_t:CDS:2 [Funneliformis geosporum]|nr:13936_t:CDS:2 [Funneliformis geosporum]
MASQSYFNDHYKSLLDQLLPSIKKEAWLHLITCKNNPLSEEQARRIHPNIEELLISNVNRYYKSKNRQKIKIEANITSNCSSIFSQLDVFEKQLEEIAEERKCLKDEYDALIACKKSKYNNCIVDMKQKIYSFKYQLENQQKSSSNYLEKQYKSHISMLEKAMIEKDKEIVLDDIIYNKD